MKAIYPGTFDPITYGHLDVLKRATKVFEEVTIVVMNNPRKHPFFTLEERLYMIKKTVKDLENVKVDSHCGLLVQYVKEHEANIVIRGLRALEDFEYEFEMALTNRQMYPNLEIIYLITDLKYLFVSSSMVKEIAQFNGELGKWVPPTVEEKLREKFKK